MPGMPPRKIDHIFQCLSFLLASCPLSLLEKTSHLVCLPGKQASSFQKKASASDQPTGSVLLLTTIVSLKVFSFWIIAFRLSKHLLTAYTGSVALVTLLLKVPRNSGQQTWHQDFIQKIPKRTGLWPDLFSAVVTDVLSHQPAIEEFVQINGWVSEAFT